MFGLTEAEAEMVQSDPTAAVQLLVVRQLKGLAAVGRRVVLLVDALDEADEPGAVEGSNPVVQLLKELGQAQTGALSVVVTTRPEPALNLRILEAGFGTENVRVLPPDALRAAGDALAAPADDRFFDAPNWAAAMQAHEQSKIYQVVCRGFVAAWRAAGRLAARLPPPPADIDGAYR